jgi:hypothetical protein
MNQVETLTADRLRKAYSLNRKYIESVKMRFADSRRACEDQMGNQISNGRKCM